MKVLTRLTLLLLPVGLGLAGCRGAHTIPPADTAALVEGRDPSAPAIRRAAQQLDAGQADAAFESLVAWFQTPASVRDPDRDLALYLAANALIEERQRIKAFYYLDELLDLHRSSPLYADAARRQFEIAESYLRGEHDKALFLQQSTDNDALEMLFRVQFRVPGSELAEAALLRTADYYFEDEQFDFAEDAYTVFVERFPRSDDVPEARLRQAWSNLLQYQGPRYDPTPLLDARQQFEAFANAYPGRADAARLQDIRDYIDRELAKKDLIKASYYARTNDPDAAEQLRERVVEAYPDTPQGERARRLIRPTTRRADDAGAGE